MKHGETSYSVRVHTLVLLPELLMRSLPPSIEVLKAETCCHMPDSLQKHASSQEVWVEAQKWVYSKDMIWVWVATTESKEHLG